MSGETFVVVSREEFFAYIGPLNVHPRSEPECSYWETPNRRVVGKTTPGYRDSGTTKVYMLHGAARRLAEGGA